MPDITQAAVLGSLNAVSYTHLDVYKRQILWLGCWSCPFLGFTLHTSPSEANPQQKSSVPGTPNISINRDLTIISKSSNCLFRLPISLFIAWNLSAIWTLSLIHSEMWIRDRLGTSRSDGQKWWMFYTGHWENISKNKRLEIRKVTWKPQNGYIDLSAACLLYTSRCV